MECSFIIILSIVDYFDWMKDHSFDIEHNVLSILLINIIMCISPLTVSEFDIFFCLICDIFEAIIHEIQ